MEREGFDLIVMGRPEGQGCYCFANNVLREVLATLARNYRHFVIDSEAGLEHISRRTLLSLDHLLIVSDCTARGIHTAARIAVWRRGVARRQSPRPDRQSRTRMAACRTGSPRRPPPPACHLLGRLSDGP